MTKYELDGDRVSVIHDFLSHEDLRRSDSAQ